MRPSSVGTSHGCLLNMRHLRRWTSGLQLLLLLLLSTAMTANTTGTKITQADYNKTSNIASPLSRLRPVVERVFSRRRRFVVMPKGGAIKFTVSASKRLLAMYPRGFNFGYEAAVYYPGVASREDLIPKRLRKPTPTTPKPAATNEPLLVYIPGTELRFKAKPAPTSAPRRPASKPVKLQRLDSGTVQWLESQTQQHKFANPQHWQKYAKYGTAAYQQKYAWTPAKEAKHRWTPAKQAQYSYQPSAQAKWTRWTTQRTPVWQPRSGSSYAEWPQRRLHRIGRDGRSLQRAFDDAEDAAELDAELMPIKRMEFEDLAPYEENWPHFHGHRDRRQLFHSFESLTKILGFDVRSCILRSLCECQRVLLPPGYSMLHDMLRVVFTMPTQEGMRDDYSRAMQANATSCEQEFRQKCPISLLGWFLNPSGAVKA